MPSHRRCPGETFPSHPHADRRRHAGVAGCSPGERGAVGRDHVHDPPHERLPRPAGVVGQQPGDRPGRDDRERRAHRGRCRQGAPRRRRRRDAGQPAVQSWRWHGDGQGPADHRGVQGDGLRRGDLREPRVRLGPDEPGQSDGPGGLPVRDRQHRQERHRQLRHGRLDQAGLCECAVPGGDDRGRAERGQGRLRGRHHDRDSHDHRFHGDRRALLQGPGRVDPPLLRRR